MLLLALCEWIAFNAWHGKRLVWGTFDAVYARFVYLGQIRCDMNRIFIHHADGRLVSLLESPHYTFALQYATKGQVSGSEEYRQYIARFFPELQPHLQELKFEKTILWLSSLQQVPEILVRLRPFASRVEIIDGAHRAAAAAALGHQTMPCFCIIPGTTSLSEPSES